MGAFCGVMYGICFWVFIYGFVEVLVGLAVKDYTKLLHHLTTMGLAICGAVLVYYFTARRDKDATSAED